MRRIAVALPSGGDAAKAVRPTVPWLLVILCVILPLVPQNAVLPGPLRGNGSPARIIAVALFGLVLLGFFTQRRTSAQPRLNAGAVVIIAYFGLWLSVYGTGLLTADRLPGWTAIEANRTRSLITLCAHVGLALYVMRAITTFRQRNVLLACFAVGLSIVNAIALLQSIGAIDLRALFVPPQFVNNVDDLTDLRRLGLTRVLGTAQHPIEFSVLAAVSIPLTLYFARNAVTRNGRIFAVFGCVLALIAMPAAVSRSGLVSLIAAMAFYMFAFRARVVVGSIIASAVAVLLYVVSFPSTATALWSTVTGSAEDESIRGRTVDYAVVGDIFREHILFGLGLGGQPTLLDNQWLQAIVQGGLTGIAAMLLLTVGTLFGISSALRAAAASVRERQQAYLIGAMVIGILVSSTTFDSFYYQQITFMLFILYGMLWAAHSACAPSPPNSAFDAAQRSDDRLADAPLRRTEALRG